MTPYHQPFTDGGRPCGNETPATKRHAAIGEWSHEEHHPGDP